MDHRRGPHGIAVVEVAVGDRTGRFHQLAGEPHPAGCGVQHSEIIHPRHLIPIGHKHPVAGHGDSPEATSEQRSAPHGTCPLQSVGQIRHQRVTARAAEVCANGSVHSTFHRASKKRESRPVSAVDGATPGTSSPRAIPVELGRNRGLSSSVAKTVTKGNGAVSPTTRGAFWGSSGSLPAAPWHSRKSPPRRYRHRSTSSVDSPPRCNCQQFRTAPRP